MSDLTAVSLFAGIGGFDEALRRAGVHVAAAVEIDDGCRATLRRHFPGTRLFNDVTEVSGDQLRAAGFVPGRGVLCGGWPCQDLSLAGRRAGLGGARSGLFWHVVRLARELRPRWLVLENVPGLLSAVCPCPGDGSCTRAGRAVRCGRWEKRDGKRVFTPSVHHTPKGGACEGGCMETHGGAMGAVVGALEQLGYGLCWRVLDAQYFGVPQRRDRVFFAGCLGDGAAPVEVLLEPESGDGDSAAGRQTGPGDARASSGGAGIPRTVGTLGTTGPGGGWGIGADEAAAGQLVASTLQGGGRRGHRIDAEGAAGGHLVPVLAAPLTAGSATGGGVNRPGRRQEDDVNLVAHALTSEGADASEDGTGRGTPLVTVPVMSLAVAGDFSSGEDVAQTVRSAHGQPGNIGVADTVRRLSPLECERLQGFPDNWTRWDATGTEQSDSARYRRLGNAVAVPVVEWIANRLVAVDARTAQMPAEGAA